MIRIISSWHRTLKSEAFFTLKCSRGPRASQHVFCFSTDISSSSDLTDYMRSGHANEDKNERLHVPVLCNEAINFLQPSESKVYLDMTFGAGGHTKSLLCKSRDIKVYALDRDPTAYCLANTLAESYPNQLIPLHGKFSDLPKLLKEKNVPASSFDGILFDVGCSSMQFDQGERGFSVIRDGPLDMRMSGKDSGEPNAADVINSLDSESLARILKVYGEVKAPKKIAQVLVEAKYMMQPIKTTRQLVMAVKSAYTSEAITSEGLNQAAHVATKIFQAFRIFVNNELNEFYHGMKLAHKYLKTGGIVVTICFHSLEDRIVKSHFNNVDLGSPTTGMIPGQYNMAGKYFTKEEISDFTAPKWNVLTKKAIVPSPEEILANSRSRSGKLRAAAKV